MPRRRAEGLGSNISRRAAGPGSGCSSYPLGRLGHGVSSALKGSLETGPPLDEVNIKGAKAPVIIRPPHSSDPQTRSKLLYLFNAQQDKACYRNGSRKAVSILLMWAFATESRSIRVNGAECGVESILLGVVTSVGGFLFGYDTGQISGMLIFSDFVRLPLDRKAEER
jgi:hypothetical protein